MASEIEIDADDLAAGLTALEAELDRELYRSLAISADMVERDAKLLAPHVTGTLKDSIRATPPQGTLGGGDLEAAVQADAPYALPVHDGARPHVIRAWRAGALAFRVGGRLVVTQSVNHPGNAPNPFLERAVEARADDINAELGDAHDRAMERAGFR